MLKKRKGKEDSTPLFSGDMGDRQALFLVELRLAIVPFCLPHLPLTSPLLSLFSLSPLTSLSLNHAYNIFSQTC